MAAIKSLMGPGCLARSAGITIHLCTCSYILPFLPFLTGTCSLRKTQPRTGWGGKITAERRRFSFPAHSNDFLCGSTRLGEFIPMRLPYRLWRQIYTWLHPLPCSCSYFTRWQADRPAWPAPGAGCLSSSPVPSYFGGVREAPMSLPGKELGVTQDASLLWRLSLFTSIQKS